MRKLVLTLSAVAVFGLTSCEEECCDCTDSGSVGGISGYTGETCESDIDGNPVDWSNYKENATEAGCDCD